MTQMTKVTSTCFLFHLILFWPVKKCPVIFAQKLQWSYTQISFKRLPSSKGLLCLVYANVNTHCGGMYVLIYLQSYHYTGKGSRQCHNAPFVFWVTVKQYPTHTWNVNISCLKKRYHPFCSNSLFFIIQEPLLQEG